MARGNAATTYLVKIDVKVAEVIISPNMGEMGSLNVALSSDNSGQGNIFRVVPDSKMDSNTNGTTIGENYIQVKDSRANSDTGAHEMGHTLGLDHNTSGLMTPASADSGRSNDLKKSDIKDIISYPLNRKVNYESDSTGNRTNAGKGTVINNTTYTDDQLKKGHVK